MKYTANDTIPIRMCPVNAAPNDKAVAAMYKTDVFIFTELNFVVFLQLSPGIAYIQTSGLISRLLW